MTVHLPKSISDYFGADKGDADSVAQCFTEDATVADEGKTYEGRDAIRAWKAASSNKYTYEVTPSAIEEREGRTVVTARLVGNFPGGQVDLRYAFELDQDKIASLEIKA